MSKKDTAIPAEDITEQAYNLAVSQMTDEQREQLKIYDYNPETNEQWHDRVFIDLGVDILELAAEHDADETMTERGLIAALQAKGHLFNRWEFYRALGSCVECDQLEKVGDIYRCLS